MKWVGLVFEAVEMSATRSSEAKGKQAKATTGADAVIRALSLLGVDIMFANPGTTEMCLVAALDRSGVAMRCVLGLHENVVTGAADGYARMKDKPAAALLHLGPGLANGLANLHNAQKAGSKVVVVVGEMAIWHQNKGSPLEMQIKPLAQAVAGLVAMPLTPDQVTTI